MHFIRRAALRAAVSPAVSNRALSTRVIVSPFRAIQQQSKATSITFRRWNSEGVKPTEEAAIDNADPVEEAHVEAAVNTAEAAAETTAPAPAFTPREASSRGRPYLTPTNSIYVGNLQFELQEQDLQREFQGFGEVKKVTLATDARGLSKGFGYVEFDSVEAATAAIKARDQTILEGRRLVVNYQGKTSVNTGVNNPPSKTLFIGNLAFEMSDADLNKLFRDIRNVIDVRVAIDRRTGQPRGFAHADFVDVESAEKALALLQGKDVYGRRLRVDYSQSKVARLDRGPHSGQAQGAGGASF